MTGTMGRVFPNITQEKLSITHPSFKAARKILQGKVDRAQASPEMNSTNDARMEKAELEYLTLQKDYEDLIKTGLETITYTPRFEQIVGYLEKESGKGYLLATLLNYKNM
jgi:hypothetical protein